MGKRQRQQEFDLHALGKLSQALVFIQRKAAEIIAIGFVIPAGVKVGGHGGDLPHPAALIVGRPARRIADLLLDLLFVGGKGQPEIADLAGIGVDKP